MSDSNITLLPAAPNDFRATIEQIKRHFDDHLEFIKLDAKLRHAKYQAFVDAGFSPEQALLLVRG